MQDALLTFSSKPAFSKLYQAIAAEFSRAEWIHQIRELVAKKMRLKYRKMTITPEDIDAATGMLIVQGWEGLYAIENDYFPCVIPHPDAEVEILLIWYPCFYCQVVTDEEKVPFEEMLTEHLDFKEVQTAIAEWLRKKIFSSYPFVTSLQDVETLSPVLYNQILSDAFTTALDIFVNYSVK